MPQCSAALTCALCHQEGYWAYCIIYIKILDAGTTGRASVYRKSSAILVLPYWAVSLRLI